jgi:hypothetical protein
MIPPVVFKGCWIQVADIDEIRELVEHAQGPNVVYGHVMVDSGVR